MNSLPGKLKPQFCSFDEGQNYVPNLAHLGGNFNGTAAVLAMVGAPMSARFNVLLN